MLCLNEETLPRKLNEELLQCKICFRRYDSTTRLPRELNCRHTVCEECLKNRCSTKKNGRLKMACPLCNSPVKLNKVGIAGLPLNATVTALLRIIENREADKSRLQSSPLSSPVTASGTNKSESHVGVNATPSSLDCPFSVSVGRESGTSVDNAEQRVADHEVVCYPRDQLKAIDINRLSVSSFGGVLKSSVCNLSTDTDCQLKTEYQSASDVSKSSNLSIISSNIPIGASMSANADEVFDDVTEKESNDWQPLPNYTGGDVCLRFGKYGSKQQLPGRLYSPDVIDVFSSGYLVIDSVTETIQIFDDHGESQSMFTVGGVTGGCVLAKDRFALVTKSSVELYSKDGDLEKSFAITGVKQVAKFDSGFIAAQASCLQICRTSSGSLLKTLHGVKNKNSTSDIERFSSIVDIKVTASMDILVLDSENFTLCSLNDNGIKRWLCNLQHALGEQLCGRISMSIDYVNNLILISLASASVAYIAVTGKFLGHSKLILNYDTEKKCLITPRSFVVDAIRCTFVVGVVGENLAEIRCYKL